MSNRKRYPQRPSTSRGAFVGCGKPTNMESKFDKRAETVLKTDWAERSGVQVLCSPPYIGVWCTVSRSHWSVKPEPNQPSLVQLQPLRPLWASDGIGIRGGLKIRWR